MDMNPIGNWRLLSLRFVVSQTGASAEMYGADPIGHLILTAEGRMMTVITRRDRPVPATEADEAALFRGMMAYSGAYRLDGDQFITAVDTAWHPSWVGTEQARTFTLDGNRLSIVTAEISHPMFPGQPGRGVLEWGRETAAG
jgi:hypothetical protein